MPRTEAQAEALKRAAIIIGVGCVVIIVGVGVLLSQPGAALGGTIGWVVAMVWTFRKDQRSRPGAGS